MKIPVANDPYTDVDFTPGRHNQKFENDQNRTDYNNQKAYELRQRKKITYSHLRKNFQILDEYMKSELKDKEVSKLYLDGKGFDFEYITGLKKIDDVPCRKIYDYILIHTQNGNFKIIEND